MVHYVSFGKIQQQKGEGDIQSKRSMKHLMCGTLHSSKATYIHFPSIIYRKISNIRPAKSQNLNVSGHSLQLSLPNIVKPSVRWRIKM